MNYLNREEHRAAVLVLIILFSPLMIALIYTKCFVFAGLLWAVLVLAWFLTLPTKKTSDENL